MPYSDSWLSDYPYDLRTIAEGLQHPSAVANASWTRWLSRRLRMRDARRATDLCGFFARRVELETKSAQVRHTPSAASKRSARSAPPHHTGLQRPLCRSCRFEFALAQDLTRSSTMHLLSAPLPSACAPSRARALAALLGARPARPRPARYADDRAASVASPAMRSVLEPITPRSSPIAAPASRTATGRFATDQARRPSQ